MPKNILQTPLGHGVSHLNELTLGEAGETFVIRVVHHVMNRIQSLARGASVRSVRWATGSGAGLGRGVENTIVDGTAATLERMVQTEPMSYFMDQGAIIRCE